MPGWQQEHYQRPAKEDELEEAMHAQLDNVVQVSTALSSQSGQSSSQQAVCRQRCRSALYSI